MEEITFYSINYLETINILQLVCSFGFCVLNANKQPTCLICANFWKEVYFSGPLEAL